RDDNRVALFARDQREDLGGRSDCRPVTVDELDRDPRGARLADVLNGDGVLDSSLRSAALDAGEDREARLLSTPDLLTDKIDLFAKRSELRAPTLRLLELEKKRDARNDARPDRNDESDQRDDVRRVHDARNRSRLRTVLSGHVR